MSADLNWSSDDMRVECVLERRQSSEHVLSRIAGGVSDEQFLKFAGLDEPARNRVAYDLLKLGQSLNYIHVAEIFSQPRTVATSSRMGLTPGLIFEMSRSCWDLDVRTNAESLCAYLQTERPVLLMDRQSARRSCQNESLEVADRNASQAKRARPVAFACRS